MQQKNKSKYYFELYIYMYMYLFTYCIFNSIFKYLPLTSWLANTANWPQTKMNKPKQNIKKQIDTMIQLKYKVIKK